MDPRTETCKKSPINAHQEYIMAYKIRVYTVQSLYLAYAGGLDCPGGSNPSSHPVVLSSQQPTNIFNPIILINI